MWHLKALELPILRISIIIQFTVSICIKGSVKSKKAVKILNIPAETIT